MSLQWRKYFRPETTIFQYPIHFDDIKKVMPYKKNMTKYTIKYSSKHIINEQLYRHSHITLMHQFRPNHRSGTKTNQFSDRSLIVPLFPSRISRAPPFNIHTQAKRYEKNRKILYTRDFHSRATNPINDAIAQREKRTSWSRFGIIVFFALA